MRRHYWLLAGAIVACSSQDSDPETVPRTTSVRVSPDAFLGDQVCSPEGGMETYQATLLDVSRGMSRSFVMSSSEVVSCKSTVDFQFVQPGYRYIATIAAFDRSDLQQQNPGSPVIVDDKGESVSPRWSTVCWGYDDQAPPELGAGGVGPDEDVPLLGGSEGAPALIGIEVFDLTTAILRGCEPLVDTGIPGPTGVSFGIERSLLANECGQEAGEVEYFTISPSKTEAPLGGAGGMAGGRIEGRANCGEELILEDLPSGEYIYFDALAFEAGQSSPSWSTSCHALTVEGITVKASCSPLKIL